MYHKGATMGEKASKERRVTATVRQKVLTSPLKIALATYRAATSTPLQSYFRNLH
jgi:hypothetical protein